MSASPFGEVYDRKPTRTVWSSMWFAIEGSSWGRRRRDPRELVTPSAMREASRITFDLA